MRPELRHALRCHQEAGRTVALLTGNLHPLVAPLAAHLGVHCYSTGVETVETHTRNGSKCVRVYTGMVAGEALLHCHKTAVVEQLSKGVAADALYGFGNSRHDVDFLSLVGNPCAVAPDKSLAQHAAAAGWPVVGHR